MYNKVFTTNEMISLITFDNKYIFKSYEGFIAKVLNKKIYFKDKSGNEIKDLDKLKGLSWQLASKIK